MNLDNVKKLLALMQEHGLNEVEVEDGEGRVHLKRGGGEVHSVGAGIPAGAGASAAPAKPVVDPNLIEIKSPLVGTLYRAPKPGADSFVEIGDRVGPEKVVCIIEAMKVMNEIKAECEGTIVEVCVENGHPVEYGQVLFRVRK